MQSFSGFNSKKIESAYNLLIEKMLYILQKKIFKLDNRIPIDERKFRTYFTNVYQNIIKLEH